MGDAQTLGQQQFQLAANPLAPMAQIGSFMREAVLEELFPREVLEIRIANRALANTLVGQPVYVLKQKQPDDKPRLDSGPPLVAVERRDLPINPCPIDPDRETNQLVLHVDDLVQP